MRIVEISVTDTFGIHGTVKFLPGSVTVISADNGLGKSSILRALLYVFNGGTDPSVIHSHETCPISGCRGAEQSEVRFKLDDGTEVRKLTRPKRKRGSGEIVSYVSEVEITQPDGSLRRAPMEYISELGEAIAVDPGALLRIDASTVPGRKALAEILLKICPIDFTFSELNAATVCRSTVDIPRDRPDLPMAPEVLKDATSLEGIKKLSATVTEQRRRAGVLRDDASGACSSLGRSLPPAGTGDWNGLLSEAEEFRRQVEKAIAERKLEIELQRDQSIQIAAETRLDALNAINKEIDTKIEEFERGREARIEKVWIENRNANEQIEFEKSRQLAELESESRPQLHKAIADVTEYREKRDAHTRAEGLRTEIDRQEHIARDQSWIYTQLTDVLDRLEKLRRSKLDNLPAGIEITSDCVTIDGIPWQNVNLAKRVETAMQLCAMHAGTLPLLIADDTEHLGTEVWEALQQGIIKSGFQLVAARVVSDSPLRIEVKS